MKKYKRSVVMLAIAFGAVVYMQMHLGDAMLAVVGTGTNSAVELSPSEAVSTEAESDVVSVETR